MVRLLIAREEEVQSQHRLKHYDAITLSELTVKVLAVCGRSFQHLQALRSAVCRKLQLSASALQTMCIVKESLHALVNIDEDWQVEELRDESQISVMISNDPPDDGMQ